MTEQQFNDSPPSFLNEGFGMDHDWIGEFSVPE